LAAGSLPLISGAPIASYLYKKSAVAESSPSLSERSSNLYEAVFGGDGLVSDGWPSIAQWITTFDDMYESNLEVMSASCAQFGVADNTDDENANVKKAIQAVASSSGVDARFILAIVMQESNGCVRVQTTDNGVVNPGLMQSHDGTGSCNKDGTVQNPCPYSEIHQMIVDGVEGTSEGDGLKQILAQQGGSSATDYYKSARVYNSGSVASDGNLGQGGATACYVSDVANRLLGWSSGTSSCDSSTIGSLTGTSWTGSSSSSGSSSSASASAVASSTSTSSVVPEPTAVSTTVPVATVTPTETPAAATPTAEATISAAVVPTAVVVPTAAAATSTVPSATSSASASASAVPIYPYASSSCTEYHAVVEGDYCEKVESQYGITASDLMSWNSGLDDTCTNLWKGYRYCVKA
jgi:LysM repeat protein